MNLQAAGQALVDREALTVRQKSPDPLRRANRSDRRQHRGAWVQNPSLVYTNAGTSQGRGRIARRAQAESLETILSLTPRFPNSADDALQTGDVGSAR